MDLFALPDAAPCQIVLFRWPYGASLSDLSGLLRRAAYISPSLIRFRTPCFYLPALRGWYLEQDWFFFFNISKDASFSGFRSLTGLLFFLS